MLFQPNMKAVYEAAAWWSACISMFGVATPYQIRVAAHLLDSCDGSQHIQTTLSTSCPTLCCHCRSLLLMLL
jgi:hypothetical protein